MKVNALSSLCIGSNWAAFSFFISFFTILFYLFQSLEIDIDGCMNKYAILLDPRMQSWPYIWFIILSNFYIPFRSCFMGISVVLWTYQKFSPPTNLKLDPSSIMRWYLPDWQVHFSCLLGCPPIYGLKKYLRWEQDD